MIQAKQARWEALDILRGLSIIGMLLNLNPGAWEHVYGWLTHAKWEGGTLIDMVAPVFLFCIGAVIPLSLQRRKKAGATVPELMIHILWRSFALIVLGLFLNAYPEFDFAHMRFPGVLQRIGLSFGIVSVFVLLTSTTDAMQGLIISPRVIIGAAVFILLSYWLLLYAVPVPDFGAPRFDPVGSWPPYIDRTVFGIGHMFIYWPVDGRITFDPDGLLSVYPVCFNVLLGVLAGVVYMQKTLKRPVIIVLGIGGSMMALALLLHGICPVIKNIWTSTFALFSGGFSLVVLAGLTALLNRYKERGLFFPALVFGSNALLAYVICWIGMPLLNMSWISSSNGPLSLRYAFQLTASNFVEPPLASLLFGITYLGVVFLILLVFYKKRWFLKL